MRKKDQWRVYDIYNHKSGYYNIKSKKSFWRTGSRLGSLAKGGLTVLISVLVIYTIAIATPPASPYNPGETLNPSCAPGDTNCTVVAPAISTRNISTTLPLSGGGDLSADRTLTIGGLSSLGTANYLVGVNSGTTGWEYKQLLGTLNQITISHAPGSITFSLPQDIATTSSPTFAGLTLSTPLAISSGGTGATTASGARSNLGAAASGINTDITALQGLNQQNALQISPYGTLAGNTGEIRFLELAANGTNYVGFKAPDSLAANNIYVWPNSYPAVSGYALVSDTSGNLSWAQAGVNDATYVTLSLHDSLNAERVLTAGTNISITDGGANGNVTIATVSNPNFSTSVTTPLLTTSSGVLTISTGASAGADDIVFKPAGAEKMRILENGDLFFEKGTFDVTLTVTAPTAARTITFPDASGTVAVSATSPITLSAVGAIGLSYNTTNLQLTANALNTIQDIATSSSPTFSGLTLSGLTSGSVLFAGNDGTISQDNSNFFWDNTNKRLGIGTITPSEKLTIRQDSVGNILGLLDGANNNVLAINDGGVTTFKPSAFDTVYNFDGGTTYTDDTAEAKTSRGTAFTILAAENPSNDLFYVGLDHKFNTLYIDIATAGAGVTLAAEYYSTAWSTLTITDGTSNLTADGTITFTAPSDWTTTSVNGVTKYWIRLKSTTAITTAPTAYSVSPTTGNRFYVYAQAGDSAPALYINDKGNVGIGATSPNLKLSIVDSGVGLDRPVSNNLGFYTNGSERLRIDSFGNLWGTITAPHQIFGRFALQTHPESAYFVPIPFLFNDLGFTTERGGSVSFNPSPSGSAPSGTTINNALFDGKTSYVYWSNPTGTIAVEVTFHKSFCYTLTIGFSVTDWARAKDFVVEVYRDDTSSWETVANVTDWELGQWSRMVSYPNCISKMRFTFSDFNSNNAFRLVEVFLISYASEMGTGYFVDRGGGNVYGGINLAVNSGNVGIGTTGPTYKLDVVGNLTASAYTLRIGEGSDAGTGTWFYQLGDVGGDMAWATILAATKFAINTGDNYARTTRLFVAQNGNVGIGTTAPDVKLDVDGDIEGDLLSTGSTVAVYAVSGGGNGGTYKLVRYSSSERYKENISDFNLGLETVMKLRPVEFNWKSNGERDFGFIAEEAEKVNPFLITYIDGQPEAFRYAQYTAILTNAIKEQQKQIEELKLAINSNGNLTQDGKELANSLNSQNPLIDSIEQVLNQLGLFIKNGIAKMKEIIAEWVRTENIEIKGKIQMKDQATGEIYCIWIENGEWVKVKGECGNDNSQSSNINNETTQNTETGPACDAEHLNLCDNQEKCESKSLFWYENACHKEPACTPNWQCTDWQPLPETTACGQTFSQTRTCTDLNNCGTNEGRPTETQEATGTFCSAQNANGTCQADGTCSFTCQEGFSNCDNDWSNGCEIANLTCKE